MKFKRNVFWQLLDLGKKIFGYNKKNLLTFQSISRLFNVLTCFKLNCNFLFNSRFAFVVTAFRAYPVVLNCSATILTFHYNRRNGFMMGSSFIPSGFRYFMFRMCHFLIVVIFIF